MINRKALLYKDYKKGGDLHLPVTVLHIGTVADENGSYIAASVEMLDGEVIEIAHDRLKFTDNNLNKKDKTS